MIKNILLASRKTYRIFRIALVTGSILILNDYACKADRCGLCLAACDDVTFGTNPLCRQCIQTCLNSSGCSQEDVNDAESNYCS